MFFFFFISYCICSVSPGNAAADVRQAGNLNGHLIASYVKNVYTKNYKKSRYPSPSFYQ